MGYDIGGNQKGRMYYDPDAVIGAERIEDDLLTRDVLYPKWQRSWQVDEELGTPSLMDTEAGGIYYSPEDYRRSELYEALPQDEKDKRYKEWRDKKYGKKIKKQKSILQAAGKEWPEEEVIKKVEIDDVGEPDLPRDEDVDELYTDEEKKEKRSQMMLSMAERLIGGSRDKWGSTAQMKNIAGAVGDIRKIADPSERREMLAKYKAWGKAQADRDKAMYSDDMLVKQLIAKGAGPRKAKESVYFGEDITTMARGKSGETIRKAAAENAGQFKIIFDEEKQVYIIPSLGKEVTSIEDLIKLRKQKKI